MAQPKMPASTHQLVALLDKQFPNACPSLTDTDREVWFNAGARSVVEFLLNMQRREAAAPLQALERP